MLGKVGANVRAKLAHWEPKPGVALVKTHENLPPTSVRVRPNNKDPVSCPARRHGHHGVRGPLVRRHAVRA